MFIKIKSLVKKYYKQAYLSLFLLLLACVLLVPLTKINKSMISKQENRNLAKAAELRKNGRLNKNYGKEFDAWLSDRFRGRLKLVNLYTDVNNYIIGKLENSRAMKGKDGFLFYKGENSVANYQNKFLFTEAELEKIKNNIIKRKKILAEQGIQYYVMIAPDKNRVYGENYPDDYIRKYAKQGRAEQLVEYLKNNGIDIVYPLNAILEAKKEGTLYFRLDTHWNNSAAFLGYTAMMQEVAKNNPDVKSLTFDDFVKEFVPEKSGELLGMLNIKIEDVEIPDNKVLLLKKKSKYNYVYIKNKGRKGVEIVNKNPLNNLRLLMLRDSFTEAMEPYFSETFSEAKYIWNHNFNANYEAIRAYKPNIVIHEMVERYVHVLLLD